MQSTKSRKIAGSVLGLFVVVNLGWGQVPKVDSTVERSVDATRQSLKDIELMQKGIAETGKTSADPALNLTSGLQLSGTALLTPGPTSKNGLSLREAERKQWEADNWLLVGIQNLSQKPTGSTTSAASGSESSSSAELELSGTPAANVGQWLATGVQAAENESKSSEASSETKRPNVAIQAQVVNPLEAFMQDWVQPEDLELLTELGSGGKGPASLQSLEIGPLQPLAMSDRTSFERTSGLSTGQLDSATATVNPFLAGWGDGGSTSEGPDLSFGRNVSTPDGRILDQARGLTPASNPSPIDQNIESSRSKPKENWQPPARSDEKYFPRLKRF